jgi:hypothetical protein
MPRTIADVYQWSGRSNRRFEEKRMLRMTVLAEANRTNLNSIGCDFSTAIKK